MKYRPPLGLSCSLDQPLAAVIDLTSYRGSATRSSPSSSSAPWASDALASRSRVASVVVAGRKTGHRRPLFLFPIASYRLDAELRRVSPAVSCVRPLGLAPSHPSVHTSEQRHKASTPAPELTAIEPRARDGVELGHARHPADDWFCRSPKTGGCLLYPQPVIVHQAEPSSMNLILYQAGSRPADLHHLLGSQSAPVRGRRRAGAPRQRHWRPLPP